MKHRPYIGLTYGRYLQFRFLKAPLKMGWQQIKNQKNVFIVLKKRDHPTKIDHAHFRGWEDNFPLKLVMNCASMFIEGDGRIFHNSS